MKRKIVFIAIFISSFLMTRAVFAYDDKTTHPALTDEAIDFYNITLGDPTSSGGRVSISVEEKEWIIEGSILEDTPPRWVNHFYDPIYKVGWTGETGSLNPQEVLKQFTDLFLSNGRAVSALDWVHNQELQNQYKLYRGNQTWEKAIYEYVKNKNKKAAYSTLGYVLHLLEDMAVPDHTRDDTHPNDSPYENYSTRFTRDTFHIVDDLKSKNEQPIILNSLDDYFESLSEYSNNYFFSKDTINDAKYNKPKIIDDDGIYAYGLDENNKTFPLVITDRQWNKTKNDYDIIYLLDKNEPLYYSILQSYFVHLSREAVLSGAGVIDLFFKEVEKAENDPSLLKKPPENISTIFSLYGEIDKFSNFINDIYSGVKNLTDSIWYNLTGNDPAAIVQSLAPSQPPVVSPPQQSDIVLSDVARPKATELSLQVPVAPPAPSIPPPSSVPPSNNPSPQSFTPSLPYPGFGGGGDPAPPPAVSSSQEPSSPTPSAPPALPSEAFGEGGDTTPPNPPAILSPNNFSQIFTSATIIFSGIAEAQSIISNDFNNSTTTADSGGTWSLNFILNQGTTTIKFFSQDEAGNISSSTDVSLFVDSTAPSIDSFSILECSESLSPDGCLLATTTMRLLWQTSANDLDYFELTHSTNSGQVQNNAVSNITATSTTVVVQNNSTNTFSIRAKDKAGNWSLSQIVTAEISTMPVVINEVAWAGTGLQTSSDEWIELYNRTNYDIDLSGWRLYSSDAGPDIIFGNDSGNRTTINKIIPANGYYLIERTKDEAVNNIPADWYGSFTNGLDNNGEILTLSHASTIIDQTILCGMGSTQWCPGFDYKYRTMERINLDMAGTEPTNWSYNNPLIRNGKTATDEDISGTPKARNSVDYLIVKTGSNITSDLTLKKSKSPYIVDNTGITVNAGITLTIEPGVVIKFYNDAGMGVFGKIIAQGTADEPVVFTSFNDDVYGGDLDATSATPAAGSWYGIDIVSGNSIFDNAIFRYGGKWYNGVGNSMANLSIKDASAAITNSIFEYSKVYGLKLTNSNSTVSDSIFRNNNYLGEGGATGMLVEAGSEVLIQSSSFSDNRTGIYYSNSPIKLENVRFENNVWGVSADSASAALPISVSSVEFFGSGATTSPSGLW